MSSRNGPTCFAMSRGRCRTTHRSSVRPRKGWGLATFVHRTLPITGQVQGFVHKAFSPNGYGEHPRSRSAHVVWVFVFEKGRFVCVAHMHGLRDPGGKADIPQRIAQANRLAELVQQIAESDDPVVVCGDFDVEPGSRTFEILGRIGLVDLVTARGVSGTRTSHYSTARNLPTTCLSTVAWRWRISLWSPSPRSRTTAP